MTKLFALPLLMSSLLFTLKTHALEISFPKNQLTAQLNWELGPTEGSESVLRLQFFDASNKAHELGSPPQVVLWMPDMGHGSGPTSVQRILDSNGDVIPGTYLIRSMYFIMAGPWEIKISIKNSQGALESQIFKIEI